jgi:hypothetical protein
MNQDHPANQRLRPAAWQPTCSGMKKTWIYPGLFS